MGGEYEHMIHLNKLGNPLLCPVNRHVNCRIGKVG